MAVLGALLVGGCSLDDEASLGASQAQIAAAEANDAARTAQVRAAVACDLGAPWTDVSRPTPADPAMPPSGSARPASTARGALGDGSVPTLNYAERRVDTDTVMFTASHHGKVRVAISVVRSNAQWTWDTLAACDQAELPAASDSTSPAIVWTDSAGKRVSTRTVRTERLNRSVQECYGEHVSMVVLDGRRYVSDPLGAYTGTTYGKYRDGATLPPGATDSGLRFGKDALWRTTGTDYVYLVDGTNTRRLPLEKSDPPGVC